MTSATPALRRLRMVSTPEAVSFLVLLTCSVLKRTADEDFWGGAVMVMGLVHGALFVAYGLLWLDAWRLAKWKAPTAAWFLLMSVLPTGGFFADRALRRREGAEAVRPEPAAA